MKVDVMETHYIDLIKFRKALKKRNMDLNDPKDRITLLFDIKARQNLISKLIKMDNFANEIYNKTQQILQDKKKNI